MATEDEILNTPIPDHLIRDFKGIVARFQYTTNALQVLEEYLNENDDPKAARLVEQATLKVCAHEAT